MANPLLLGVLKKKGFSAAHYDLNFNFRQSVDQYIKISKVFSLKNRTKPIYNKKTGKQQNNQRNKNYA